MEDAIVRPRPLTKADLKRIRKRFREGHQHSMWRSGPLSSWVWGEVASDLAEVEEIGFTGVRRAEAMARLEQAMTRLYQERFSASYTTAFSARYIYDYLVDELEAYGVRDRRSEEARAFDAAYVLSADISLEGKWAEVETPVLERAATIVEKEPIDLTDEDLSVLKSFTLNPYGDAAPATVREADRRLAAIERVLESYSTLSPDVQLALGGEQGLLSQKQDLVEGPRSYHGSRVNYVKSYRGRYEQARYLLQEELEGRRAVEASKQALAAAASADG